MAWGRGRGRGWYKGADSGLLHVWVLIRSRKGGRGRRDLKGDISTLAALLFNLETSPLSWDWLG